MSNIVLKFRKIKEIISSLNNFKVCLRERYLPPINFGEIVTKKYLNIISNIFYFNLRKVSKEYKKKHEEKVLNFKEGQDIFNSLYKDYLKSTRNEVLNAFGLPQESDGLSLKLLLRIFPFYYDKNNELRITYDKMNDDVNQVIQKIIVEGQIAELVDDNHKQALTAPKDVFIF